MLFYLFTIWVMKKILSMVLFVFLLFWVFNYVNASENSLSSSMKKKVNIVVDKFIQKVENKYTSIEKQISVYEKLNDKIIKLQLSSNWDKLLLLDYLLELFSEQLASINKDNFVEYNDIETNFSFSYPNTWKVKTENRKMASWKYTKIITLNTDDFKVGKSLKTWERETNIQIEFFLYENEEMLEVPYWMFFWEEKSKVISDKNWNNLYIKIYIHKPFAVTTENVFFEEYNKEIIFYLKKYSFDIEKVVKSFKLSESTTDKNNYKLISKYYNLLLNKDYESAYNLKYEPWYSINKFKELYSDVTEAFPTLAKEYYFDVEVVSENEYLFKVLLYLDNWKQEKYSVQMKIIYWKLKTISSVKIDE